MTEPTLIEDNRLPWLEKTQPAILAPWENYHRQWQITVWVGPKHTDYIGKTFEAALHKAMEAHP